MAVQVANAYPASADDVRLVPVNIGVEKKKELGTGCSVLVVLPPGTFARLPTADTLVGTSEFWCATRQTLPVVALDRLR